MAFEWRRSSKEPAPAYVPLGEGEKARPTEPKPTGRITNGNGLETEAQVRGKRADYYGEYQGDKVGIAIVDHSGNPRHPTYWHTSGYGMFAANIFGVRTFENNKSPEWKPRARCRQGAAIPLPGGDPSG